MDTAHLEELLAKILHQLEAQGNPRVYETKVLDIAMPPPGKIANDGAPNLAEMRRQLGAEGWEIEHATPTQPCRSTAMFATGYYITMYLRRPRPIEYPASWKTAPTEETSAAVPKPAPKAAVSIAATPVTDVEDGVFKGEWIPIHEACVKLHMKESPVRAAVRAGNISKKTIPHPKGQFGRTAYRVRLVDLEAWRDRKVEPPAPADDLDDDLDLDDFGEEAGAPC